MELRSRFRPARPPRRARQLSGLEAARAGEPWALQGLVAEWNRPLTAFVRARGVSDVDEVVNDILLGVVSGISRFDGNEAELRAWVFRIARNKIADAHRRTSRRPRLVLVETAAVERVGGDAEAEASARLGRVWLDEVLAELTDDQRDVLLLRTVADLTVDQVAAVLGRRRGAVKQLQRRALRRLERLLAERPDLDPYPWERS